MEIIQGINLVLYAIAMRPGDLKLHDRLVSRSAFPLVAVGGWADECDTGRFGLSEHVSLVHCRKILWPYGLPDPHCMQCVGYISVVS